jgi:nucleotide-binding universal stress UspA family protein
MGYKRILVPVDGSPTSARGVAEAIKLAQSGGAKLLLLHVVEEYAILGIPEAGASIGPVLDALNRAGRITLAKIERGVRRLGVRAETKLVEDFSGRVANAIVDQAKRWRADVIVMGTHGRRGLNRMMLGSDAELVVRYSTVPVLLVPARNRK